MRHITTIEFYLVIAAVTAISVAIFGSFYRLSNAIGYFGETGLMNVTVGFVIGMVAWLYIIYEIFLGETAAANASIQMDCYRRLGYLSFRLCHWIFLTGRCRC